MGILKTQHKVDHNDKVSTMHRVKVHEFSIDNFEDPDIFASVKLYDWEKSDAGQFVMEHSITTPSWHKHMDSYHGYKYVILAELSEKRLSEYYLRWSPNGSRST